MFNKIDLLMDSTLNVCKINKYQPSYVYFIKVIWCPLKLKRRINPIEPS